MKLMEEDILGKQQEVHDDKNKSVDSHVLVKDVHLVYEDKKLTSSYKQCKSAQGCIQTLHYQIQPQDGVTLQIFSHLDDDMIEQWCEHVNVITSDCYHINISPNKSKQLSNGRPRLHIKRRNGERQKNFLAQYASMLKLQQILISPSENWMYDSWNVAANISNGSFLIKLRDHGSTTSSESVSSVDTRESSLMELPSSPSVASPQKPLEQILHVRDRRSLSDVSDLMVNPSTSVRYLPPVSKGLIYCLWRNGSPYFVFFPSLYNNEVIIANPWKNNASTIKGLDYMYTFHKTEDHVSRTSHVIGKMKVSSSVTFTSNRSKVKEHEFILFGVSEDQMESQASHQNIAKTKGLSKHVGNIFRTSQKIGKEECLNEFSSMYPSLELAAVVIKEHRENDISVGGWGLKFLEKEVPSISSTSENKSGRSIDVIIPAGTHGGMAMGVGGPSTLLERWRSGGKCDCGGWDVGCALSVLKSRSVDGKPFPPDPTAKDCHAENLFIEGAIQQEPSLRIEIIQEGLYAVYFKPNLSALQSFSIGVALIHSRMQSLLPDL